MSKLRMLTFICLPIELAFSLFLNSSEAQPETPEQPPDRMKYYAEDNDYKKPDLEKGIIKQVPNVWVKRSPIPGGPPSPRLGYEASLDYDAANRKIIRHGGHNQGGGGEQGFETWIYDLITGRWSLMYPDTSPPGNCCSRTNVVDQANGKFVRFPGFSGNHGWQWLKHILNLDSSVWAYDPVKNEWVNMRPFPEISLGPDRAAAYDADNQVILVFNAHEPCGTAAYDLYTNTWTLLYPKNEPPRKESYSPGFNMTYDRSRGLFILFGAGDGTDPRTFAFDIRKNEWTDMQPPTNPTYYEADPVMAYDSKNHVTICVVMNKKRGCLETWAYSAGLNRWQNMAPPKEPDATGERARLLTYSPDQELMILENRWSPGGWRESEQQIWTYRYAYPVKEDLLLAPENVKLKTTGNGMELSWDPCDKAQGYNVYHGTGLKPWLVGYDKIASLKTTKFYHRDPEKGKVHYYYVSAFDSNEESRPSFKVRSQPRVITDVIVSPASKNEVVISWKTDGEDISGYNVYRARMEDLDKRAGFDSAVPFEKINKDIIKEDYFTDNILLNKIYAYRVHAVNNFGMEAGPSPYTLTIPSPPQYLFSKEAGADCLLKWKRNPEKSVVGYNIYRTRKDKYDQKHDLLNESPIDAETFTDVNATKDMPAFPSNTGRRYYVTAVDFLGQESFPSSPVWFYREWRKFYKVGEWHQ